MSIPYKPNHYTTRLMDSQLLSDRFEFSHDSLPICSILHLHALKINS